MKFIIDTVIRLLAIPHRPVLQSIDCVIGPLAGIYTGHNHIRFLSRSRLISGIYVFILIVTAVGNNSSGHCFREGGHFCQPSLRETIHSPLSDA